MIIFTFFNKKIILLKLGELFIIPEGKAAAKTENALKSGAPMSHCSQTGPAGAGASGDLGRLGALPTEYRGCRHPELGFRENPLRKHH